MEDTEVLAVANDESDADSDFEVISSIDVADHI